MKGKEKSSPRKKESRKNKAKISAKKVLPSAKNMFPTDDESIALRRKGAAKEMAGVVRVDLRRDAFGSYDVASMQWQDSYRVEIRSLKERINTCSCKDHMMNRLGTCKHIERVLQHLEEKKSIRHRLAMYAEKGPPYYDIYFDARTYPPVLKLMRPGVINDEIEQSVGIFFSSNGTVLGTPLDALTAIDFAMQGLSSEAKRQLRRSAHLRQWEETLRMESDLTALRETYECDAADGIRARLPLKHALYPYQVDGMMHLAFRGRAILADEMGLGKTVQAIAAAEVLRQLGRVQRVLVVCPASLKAEWEDQYHFFTGGSARPVFGSKPVRLHVYGERDPFLITNYEQVRADVDHINRLYAPDLVILDEAQRIKNWPTKTAKTMKLLQSPFAFVLTGTPLENRIEELYSLVEFTNPHVFGSLFRFQREFMKVDADGCIQARNLDELHRRVSSVLLRRRKADVEDNLPERSDKNYFVEMTREQRTRYAEYDYQAGILASIMRKRPLKKEEMERLQRYLACMRMICDTPYILDKTCKDCPKLDELEPILEEIMDDPQVKIIIFSEWTGMLELIRHMLDQKKIAYALHTGSVPQQHRREQLTRFKTDPACRIFLSTEAGGTGLNLQAASVVINMDLPWNPAKLEQRIARAWRKNQQRKVRVINLIADKSIESEMVGKLAYKKALADAVLDGDDIQDVETGRDGRKMFTERLSAILNIDPAPEIDELPAVAEPGQSQIPEKSTKTESAEPLPVAPAKEYFTARYPERILSIQQDDASQAMLVITKNSEDALHVKQSLPETKAPVEVLDSDTADLLARLERQGLIQFAPELRSLFKNPAYKPETESVRRDFKKEAREVWSAAQRETKAAQALLSADLLDMAHPHLVQSVRQALCALTVLEQGVLPAGFDPPAASSDAFGAHAGIAKGLQTWLAAAPGESDVPAGSVLIREFERRCLK
ncbi:MAG: DEAD/DEAH box helicase [Spartobacteria bacterium]|nr:DEAD/DEAH box helicase [Spartobacteria bacterium]